MISRGLFILSTILIAAALGLSGCSSHLEEDLAGGAMPCIQYYPGLLVARTPYCSQSSKQGKFEYHVRFNGLGLRDRDYPPKPAPGTVRVLVLGGSVIFGGGLQEPDSPVRLLENKLRELVGPEVEVINAASEGYLAWQNGARLDEFLDAYSPDLVVYHLQGRTVFQEMAWEHLVNYTLLGDPVRLRPMQEIIPSWARILTRFKGFSWLGFLLAEHTARLDADRALSGLSEDQIAEAVLRPTIRNLNSMKRRSTQREARFVAVGGDLEIGSDTIVRKRGIRFVVANQVLKYLLRKIDIPGEKVHQLVEGAGVTLFRFQETVDPNLVDPSGEYHWDQATSRRFAEQSSKDLARVVKQIQKSRGK